MIGAAVGGSLQVAGEIWTAARGGAALWTRPGVAAKPQGLIHLTTEKGQAGISSSKKLIGRHGIFAVPESVAEQGTAMRVARTGLMPEQTIHVVRIPEAATGLFRRPIPIGPYSAWKYVSGVRYAPPGAINTVTGAFSPSSALLGPRALIYGPDILFWAVAGGVHSYIKSIE